VIVRGRLAVAVGSSLTTWQMNFEDWEVLLNGWENSKLKALMPTGRLRVPISISYLETISPPERKLKSSPRFISYLVEVPAIMRRLVVISTRVDRTLGRDFRLHLRW
jgi:hypothetical protein